MVGESSESVSAGFGGGSTGSKMPTLEEYGTNLTKLAEEVSCFYAYEWHCFLERWYLSWFFCI